jgi:hypothetical protein
MKYWTYMKGEVPGSYEPEALAALPGFGMTTLVCAAQGEIAEKNWRRAGEFEDIARAVSAHQAKQPPSAPQAAPPVASEIDALLDTASTRLFSHVADLMKELETRRDEKSLVASLQRQIAALKQELVAAREQANLLEIRMPHIAALEESQRKNHADLIALQATLVARDAQISETRAAFEKMRMELGTAKQRLQETTNDLAIRNRLIDKLSQDLSEKELSLAKSLGVIRRLEEDLNRLCPSPELRQSAAETVELPSVSEPKAAPAAKTPVQVKPEKPAPAARSLPSDASSTFTNDDPPPPPDYLEPRINEGPKAHEALLGFFKKVFPGQPH